MAEFVIVLRTTGPDGGAWEQTIGPRFQSEAEARAWRNSNALPDSCQIEAINGSFEGPLALLTGPVSETLRKKWDDGDIGALFIAVRSYSLFQLPMPQWCWHAIHEASTRFVEYEVRDLNEAFGFDPKTRGRVPDRARQARLQWKTFLACHELKDSGKPVDAALFEEAAQIVADRFNERIGKTTAAKYYYAALREFKEHLDD